MTYTSYFAKMKQIKTADKDAVFIAICGGIPEWYDGHWLKKIAPKYTWWKVWHDTYKGRYESKESIDYYTACYKNTVLGTLSQKDVLNDIEKMADGHNAYLLCYETPDKFCHRHLLANWLNEKAEHKVSEWTNKCII